MGLRCTLGGVAMGILVVVSALFAVCALVEVGVRVVKGYGGAQDFGSQVLGLGIIGFRVFTS